MTDAVARLTSALADRYTIERELGAGGMATVYLAHDVRHDRKVALKVLRPELSAILGAERFVHEIKTTANLQHPHILSLFDSGEADGLVYYVMPYVEGESLRDRLNREKQLPVEDAVRIAREVADALQYAHEHGIVHRDIKPENILLHGGHAMVADFGIALAAAKVEGGSRMTETGMSLGTPHYMSPEQSMGEREITPKADIYAIGCVLYEMLTAEPPFTGATAQAIIARVMTEEPRSLTLQRRSIPPHVEAAVRTALEKLPADRFATAAEFAAALVNPAFTATGAPARTTAVAEGVLWRRRASLALRLSPLLIAGGVLGATLAVYGRRPLPSPVARFSVSMSGGGFTPALSPTGDRIVYPGLDSQRTPRLFMRALDGEEVVRIPGTDLAQNTPAFSPDGQWLAFRAGGVLRKLALGGGASLPICDVPGSYGGTSWSDHDVIVFVRNDSLFRIGAGGGQPALVLAPDSGSSQRYLSPHFLPGGKLLVASRTTVAGVELVRIDLDRRQATSLGIAGMSPSYVGQGWLVYADVAGTALAVPFNARTGRVTGSAQPIAENVSLNAGRLARLGTSRSGAIAYATGASSAQRELVLLERGGRAQVVPLPPGGYRFPRFSPDGRRIAIGLDGTGRTLAGDIWALDLASNRLTRLTFDTLNVYPEWTPDGRSIVFAHLTGGSYVLYRVAADGSANPEPFFGRGPSSVFEGRLVDGGRHMVFREDANGLGRNRDILVAPVDSPAAARALAATNFNESGIAVSPDGGWLAFSSTLSGVPEVYLRRIADGSPRWKVSTRGGTEPRWGPGARELYYRSVDTVFAVSMLLGAEPRIGEPKALFTGAYQGGVNEPLYDVSPDGRRFAMIRPLGAQAATLHVILHRFDGGRP